jgi:hypothetical protein
MSIALVYTRAQPAALPYYTLFPKEPIPKASGEFVAVEKTVGVEDETLTTMLKTILKNVKAGGNLLCTMHGSPWGLRIQIINRVGLEAAAMRLMLAVLEGRQPDSWVFKELRLDDRAGPAAWKPIKELIQKVRALEINRLDLRACQVGDDPDTMYYLQRFFNCKVCCAPSVWDVFGVINLGSPTKSKETWEAWLKQHKRANRHGDSSGVFAYEYTITGNQISVDAMADSEEAAKAWVKRNLPPGNYSRGPIHYHALTPDKQRLVFAGEEKYREYLVEAQYAKDDPPPKADPNAPIR